MYIRRQRARYLLISYLLTRIALSSREVSDFVALLTTGEGVDVVPFSKECGNESRFGAGTGLSGKVMKSSVNKCRVKKVSNTALNRNI